MVVRKQDISIECCYGDIADQPDIDAIVNAANAQLRIGGGVAGAIHRTAGPGLKEECRPLVPVRPGQAVITSAHELPNKYVIHCLGPVYGQDEPSDKLLADCYRNALHLADEHRLRSIAFPAISTGAFGYPVEPAAQIAIHTILYTTSELSHIRHIRMVLYSKSDLDIHRKVLMEADGRPHET